MCSHYQGIKERERYIRHFGVEPPPKGEVIHSYTMLTINADDHPLMRLFHKPTDEKRMVVILPPERYQDWLEAPAERSMEFIRSCPAESLKARAASQPGVSM